MKGLTCLVFFIVMIGCSSSGNQETATNDSTTLNDTLDVAAFADEESDEVDQVNEDDEEGNDTSQLEITFDETAGLVFERQEPYYTVSITTSQYEASSDVTWYFDGDFYPIYFKETSAMEGTEGSVEYFIEDGVVVCALVEESYGDGGSTEKWCVATGGTITQSDSENPEISAPDFGSTCNSNLKRYLDILKAILAEAEVESETEDSYSLAIVNTTQIGESEVEESTRVNIPKKVYEALK